MITFLMYVTVGFVWIAILCGAILFNIFIELASSPNPKELLFENNKKTKKN